MKTSDLVSFEIEHFKKSLGGKICFSKLDVDAVDYCIHHALLDSLKQAARRYKVSYKSLFPKIKKTFGRRFLDIAQSKTKITSKTEFDNIFATLKDDFLRLLNEAKFTDFANIGFAQKFINMTFKYLYCFDNCSILNMQFCHLPLDRYTILWYKKYGDTDIVKRLKKKNYAWTNIDDDLYFGIQNDINKILSNGIDFPINCKNPNQTIRLPKNKIEVDFIVWVQQQLNDVYNKSLSKLKDYFDRLGISEL